MIQRDVIGVLPEFARKFFVRFQSRFSALLSMVRLTVSTKLVPDTATLELVLFYKESVLSAGTVVVAHKSTEGVRTKASFQALAVPRDGYINTVMHL